MVIAVREQAHAESVLSQPLIDTKQRGKARDLEDVDSNIRIVEIVRFNGHGIRRVDDDRTDRSMLLAGGRRESLALSLLGGIFERASSLSALDSPLYIPQL